MYHDGVVLAHAVDAPHGFVQARLGEYDPRMLAKIKRLKDLRGTRHRLSQHRKLACGFIDLKPAEVPCTLYYRSLSRHVRPDAATAQTRLDPCGNLQRIKGLGDIIVPAHRKPGQHIQIRRFGRQKQDVRTAVGTDLRTEIKSCAVRRMTSSDTISAPCAAISLSASLQLEAVYMRLKPSLRGTICAFSQWKVRHLQLKFVFDPFYPHPTFMLAQQP